VEGGLRGLNKVYVAYFSLKEGEEEVKTSP